MRHRHRHLLTRVLGGEVLGLGSNATLLGVTVGSLLTAVEEVGIILGDRGRVVGHLGSDLVDGALKVALLGKVRLLFGAQWASLGGGAALVGGCEALSIGRDAVLGWLGLTNGASLGRLQVVGIFGRDGAGIRLHLADHILSRALKVLQRLVSKLSRGSWLRHETNLSLTDLALHLSGLGALGRTVLVLGDGRDVVRRGDGLSRHCDSCCVDLTGKEQR